ncbi:MAG: protein phosphatase 2C domain-containing protein [Arenicellales bacterium]
MVKQVLEMSCATDVGAVRKGNEDSVAVFPQLNLAILADGMGGHKAGEIASRRAIEVVRDAVRDGLNIKSAVVRANSEVYLLSTTDEAYSGMGTTLVAAHYDGVKVSIVCVGDSRLYRFRNNQFEQITVDQTVAQDMKDNNIEHTNGKHVSSFEHVLTNALGIQPECRVELKQDVMQPGDIHLLCSDGLTGVLNDEFIADSIRNRSSTLEGVIQNLFDAALRRLAPDNISVAMVHANTLRRVNEKLSLSEHSLSEF